MKNEAIRTLRPEKVEEITTIWSNPRFKNNNQRLTELFHNCKTAMQGYTIREFAYGIFPDEMRASDLLRELLNNTKTLQKIQDIDTKDVNDLRESSQKIYSDIKEIVGSDEEIRFVATYEYNCIMAIRMMIHRFKKHLHNIDPHSTEIVLCPALVNGKWYYYNIIDFTEDDKKVFRAHELRSAKILLGIQKMMHKLGDVMEMSPQEREKINKEQIEAIERKIRDRKKKKSTK